MAGNAILSPDVRITVFDPLGGTIKSIDASGDVKGAGAYVEVEDTITGCGAATIILGVQPEDMITAGVWAPMNIVEVSAAEGVMTAAINTNAASFTAPEIAAGVVARIYVDSTSPWDPVWGEDKQQAFLMDGATRTMRIPVVSLGVDGTGKYLAVKSPLPGGGNPVTFASYLPTVTIVGARRYAGRISRRRRATERVPTVTLSCVGLGEKLERAVDTITIGTGTAVDAAAVLLNALQKNATRWPQLSIDSGTYPTAAFPSTGLAYSGTIDRQTLASFISDVLTATTVNGDVYALRVGHDGFPRLVKPYDGVANTFAYPVTLTLGRTHFEPLQVQIDDDASNVYNTVEVLGDTDPISGQPFAAIVQDAASIALYGQIDLPPVQNNKLKTQDACARQAQALLSRSAIATANAGFRVYIRNDDAVVLDAPAGGSRGVVVRGLSGVTVARFENTGVVRNLVADSDLLYNSGPLSKWTGTSSYVPNALGQSGAFSFTADGGSYQRFGLPIAVVPGEVLTLSAQVKLTGTVSGAAGVVLTEPGPGALVGTQAFANPGIVGTWQTISTTITIPTGASYSSVLPLVASGGTGGGNVQIARFQVEPGGAASGYVANNTAPDQYGLATSVKTRWEPGRDAYQDVQFGAVVPNWNAAMAEVGNGIATSASRNTTTNASLAGMCVSADAFPRAADGSLNLPTTGLRVGPGDTIPSFLALFAQSSPMQICGGNHFDLPPNATSWAWLNPGNTWTIRSDQTTVAGAIRFAIFSTDATRVLGQYPKASVGVMKVGVGQINFGNHPTPVLTASSLTPGFTNTTLHAQVSASATLLNVPTDGTVTGLAFYYRLHGGTLLKPVGEYPVVQGSAAQTVSLSFEVGAGQLVHVYCGYVGIGSADYGPTVEIGSAPQIASGFLPLSIVVTTSYMMGNVAAAAPTISGVSFTPVSSANGLSGGMTIAFSVGNQPTDGSYSRLALYKRTTGTGSTWDKHTDFPAIGLPTPSASQAYSYTATDLTNGQQYDWAAAFEDTQGAETSHAFPDAAHGLLGSSPAASVVIIGSYLVGSVAYTPTLNGANTSLSITGRGVTTSTMRVAFEVTNQPVDQSYAKMIVYYRRQGDPTWVQFATSAPRNGTPDGNGNGAQLSGSSTSAIGDYAFTFPEAANGITFEFGIALQALAGAESNILSLGTLIAGISVPGGLSFAIAASDTYTTIKYVTQGTLDIKAASLPWDFGAYAGDFAWLDRIEIYVQFYDVSALTLPKQFLGTVTSGFAVTGTATAAALGLNVNYPSGSPSYAYLFSLKAVAKDGSSIFGFASRVCQEGAGYVSQTNV